MAEDREEAGEPAELTSLSVDEFDGGTRLSTMSDDSLWVRFPCMPPSWRCEEDAFECLEDKMGAALGVHVEGLDKELFRIPDAKPELAAALKAWLLSLRREHEQQG